MTDTIISMRGQQHESCARLGSSKRCLFVRGFHVLLALVAAGLVYPVVDLSSQAWVREKGDLYAKLTYGSSTASQQYTFDGRTKSYADNVDENSFFDRSLYAYGELGVTDDVTATLSVPFKRVIVRDATFRYRTFAFGDAELGLRYSLNTLLGTAGSSESFAANAIVSVPLAYTRNLTPSVGSGQSDLLLLGSWGHSFYPFPAYTQTSLGFRLQSPLYAFSSTTPCQEGVDKNCFAASTPDYGHEFVAGLEGGVAIADRFFVQALGRLGWSLSAPTTGFSVENPIPTHQRYIKVGGGLGVETIPNLNLSVQALATPYGRNTIASLDLSFGIDYRFQVFHTRDGEGASE